MRRRGITVFGACRSDNDEKQGGVPCGAPPRWNEAGWVSGALVRQLTTQVPDGT